MRSIRKISLFVLGAMLAMVFISSCYSGHASSKHRRPVMGSKMF